MTENPLPPIAHVSKNITRPRCGLTEAQRAKKLGQRGAVLWLTGLSGSGKSSVAYALERALVYGGKNAVVLDGDNIRFGLNKDAVLLKETSGYGTDAAQRFGLGFSPEDRAENIRRIGEVAGLLARNNVIAVTAFVSPCRADREAARSLAAPGRFFEIFIAAPLKVCEGRDPKGLYKKARGGEITDFTGVSAPYEKPLHPELILRTERESLEQSTRRVIVFLRTKGVL